MEQIVMDERSEKEVAAETLGVFLIDKGREGFFERFLYLILINAWLLSLKDLTLYTINRGYYHEIVLLKDCCEDYLIKLKSIENVDFEYIKERLQVYEKENILS